MLILISVGLTGPRLLVLSAGDGGREELRRQSEESNPALMRETESLGPTGWKHVGQRNWTDLTHSLRFSLAHGKRGITSA